MSKLTITKESNKNEKPFSNSIRPESLVFERVEDYNQMLENYDVVKEMIPVREPFYEVHYDGLWENEQFKTDLISMLENDSYTKDLRDHFIGLWDALDLLLREKGLNELMHSVATEPDFIFSTISQIINNFHKSHYTDASHLEDFKKFYPKMIRSGKERVVPASLVFNDKTRRTLISHQGFTFDMKRPEDYPLQTLLSHYIINGSFLADLIFATVELGQRGQPANRSTLPDTSAITNSTDTSGSIAWRTIASKLRYMIEFNSRDVRLLSVGDTFIDEWRCTLRQRINDIKKIPAFAENAEMIIQAIDFWDKYIVETNFQDTEEMAQQGDETAIVLVEAGEIKDDPMEKAHFDLSMGVASYQTKRFEEDQKLSLEDALATLGRISTNVKRKDAQRANYFGRKGLSSIKTALETSETKLTDIKGPAEIIIAGGADKLAIMLANNSLGLEIDPKTFRGLLLDKDFRKSILNKLRVMMRVLHPDQNDQISDKQQKLYTDYTTLVTEAITFVREIGLMLEDRKYNGLVREILAK